MPDPCPTGKANVRALGLLAMVAALLATLGLGGLLAAQATAAAWTAAAAAASVQVPDPEAATAEGTRLAAAAKLLQASPDVASLRVLQAADVAALLRPWLGAAAAAPGAPLPGMIALRLVPGTDRAMLAAQLAAAVPGAVLSTGGANAARLLALAGKLRLGGAFAFLFAALLASLLVAAGAQAALAGRNEEAALCHLLGGTEGMLTRRLVWPLARAAALGGGGGTFAGLAVLAVLAAWTKAEIVPAASWLGFLLPPLLAAAIAFLAAKARVRRWLRALP